MQAFAWLAETLPRLGDTEQNIATGVSVQLSKEFFDAVFKMRREPCFVRFDQKADAV